MVYLVGLSAVIHENRLQRGSPLPSQMNQRSNFADHLRAFSIDPEQPWTSPNVITSKRARPP